MLSYAREPQKKYLRLARFVWAAAGRSIRMPFAGSVLSISFMKVKKI